MNILLNWTYFSDLVDVPDEISLNLLKYQMKFDRWLSNPSSNHNYWVTHDGMKSLSFGSDAFINWLNDYILKDTVHKATMLESQIDPDEQQRKLPCINF